MDLNTPEDNEALLGLTNNEEPIPDEGTEDMDDSIFSSETQRERTNRRQERRERRQERREIRKARAQPLSAVRAQRITTTYAIQLVNKTQQPKKCVVFGFNLFWDSKNSGSDDDVEVRTLNNLGYKQLLAQSASRPFVINKLRLSSDSSNGFPEMIRVVSVDANGQQSNMPIIVGNHFSPFQFQASMIDIDQRVTIDGNSYLEISLNPQSSLNLTLFSDQVFSATSLLIREREAEEEMVAEREQLNQATQDIIRKPKKAEKIKLSGLFTKIFSAIKKLFTKKKKVNKKFNERDPFEANFDTEGINGNDNNI